MACSVARTPSCRCRTARYAPSVPTPPHAQLTTSEVEILRHISQGLSVTQIAARLMRSKKTISTHKRRAMRKLELSDDLSLALYLREKFAG
ncbi:LuxR C-terminal-related transcriptional regulator [Achromobacter xylosoxidans]